MRREKETQEETKSETGTKKDKTRIAIACQGGGSHTAFSAGVLKGILRDEFEKCELVALSGTSGGAICASLAWYGLLKEGDEEAIRLLDSFWDHVSADSAWEQTINTSVVWGQRLHSHIGTHEVSPYLNPISSLAQDQLREILESHIDFDEIPELVSESCPSLFVGAVNVTSGDFKVFRNEGISVDALLASSAIPNLFKAVDVDGNAYWDGLLSQNPPIRNLPHAEPDEIWVIQTNPQEGDEVPMSLSEIYDRRNELAGNLSLNQEIFFIEKINELIDEGVISDDGYRHIDVRKIELRQDLDRSSKFDRRASFIQGLMQEGEESANQHLKEL